MSTVWETRNISLPFWLGEICLFRKTFRLQTSNVDFIKYGLGSTEATTPPHTEEATTGYMLYSVPLEEGHSTIWRNGDHINYISQSFRRYYIELKYSFDDYLAQFSSKTRSTFRRKLRKYEKESGGSIDWKIYSTPQEMEEFHKLAREISKETYQEKLLDAGLPEDDGFYADMMRNAENGTVKGFLLYLDGKAVSYLYAPIYQGRMIYNHLGYLPEVSRLSAGTVLFLKVLEYLFENDEIEIFDFTEGQSDQKKQFSTSNIYCGNMLSLEYSWSNHFWLWLNKMSNGFSTAIQKALDALGIKNYIKKLLRGQN